MADYWQRIKETLFPDNTRAIESIRSGKMGIPVDQPYPDEPTPPATSGIGKVWENVREPLAATAASVMSRNPLPLLGYIGHKSGAIEGLGNKISEWTGGTVPREAVSTAADLISGYGGGGKSGASQAISGRGKSFEPFMSKFEPDYKAFRQANPHIDPEAAAGITFGRTKMERATNLVPMETPEYVHGGTSRGFYHTAGSPRVDIAQKTASRDVIKDPKRYKKAAQTGKPDSDRPIVGEDYSNAIAHEYTHAYQADKVRQRLKKLWGRKDVTTEEANTVMTELGKAASDATTVAPHIVPSRYEDPKAYRQTQKQWAKSPGRDFQGVANASKTFEKYGYKPEEVLDLLKHFKPRQGSQYTADQLKLMSPLKRSYWGNPYEIHAQAAGTTGSKAYQEFANEIFPKMRGQEWKAYLRSLEGQ